MPKSWLGIVDFSVYCAACASVCVGQEVVRISMVFALSSSPTSEVAALHPQVLAIVQSMLGSLCS